MESNSQTTDDKPASKRLIAMPNRGCYYAKWEGGGEVAKEIGGLYTSLNDLKKAVISWQEAKFPSRRKKSTIEVVLDGETRH